MAILFINLFSNAAWRGLGQERRDRVCFVDAPEWLSQDKHSWKRMQKGAAHMIRGLEQKEASRLILISGKFCLLRGGWGRNEKGIAPTN